jgi:hypothetical protein
MKRVLFAVVVLVMLLGSFSTAFAAEPDQNPAVLLGDIGIWYVDWGLPFVGIDAYLYRPATVDALGNPAWPLASGPDWGTWYWPGPDSSQRRQSWPAYQMTDEWGFYYLEFMFPRDDVWYPCGFPLQWKSNYELDPFGNMEFHSPSMMLYECRPVNPFVDECLYWPWVDLYGPAAEPMDTVSPLQVWLIDEFGWAAIVDYEVRGMYWKFSDFE